VSTIEGASRGEDPVPAASECVCVCVCVCVYGCMGVWMYVCAGKAAAADALSTKTLKKTEPYQYGFEMPKDMRGRYVLGIASRVTTPQSRAHDPEHPPPLQSIHPYTHTLMHPYIHT